MIIRRQQQKDKRLISKNGFTLIEILLVMGVLIILMSMSIAGFRLFEGKTELKSYAQNALTILELARTKTLASKDASQYGVRFEQNKYILFKGDTYQEGADDNKVYQLPSRLKINKIDLTGGDNAVVFKRISGYASSSGAIEFGTINQSATTTIAILPSGQIELEAKFPECCASGRLSDNRHVHLDLGWSIQGANTLTLYFSDVPDISININMANYFNTGQTDFDWSGEIDVNGENQELHIHTHFLDSVNSVLCIHRNQDDNNKPLNVFIDTKHIISYTDDGEFLVGPYGGTAGIQ